jgi:hypothetical protein
MTLLQLVSSSDVSEQLAFSTKNPLNVELNPICHLLAFAATPYIYDISRLKVKDWLFHKNESKATRTTETSVCIY